MKILMLSSDPLILEDNSFARKRIEKYGELVEKLIVIVISRERFKIRDSGFKNKISIISAYGGFFRFIRAFFASRKILREEKIDLITCQDIEHCLIAYLMGKLFEAQIHTDIGSPYFWELSWKNKLRYMFAKFLLKRASCIRAVSKRIKDFLVSEFQVPESKISVLPIYPQINYPASETKKFPEFQKTILVVSRLTKEKNTYLAIKAFAEVSKTHSDVGLIIVGDGPERKNLKSQISNLKINGRVKFTGYQKNLAPYYKGADIFLLTSWYEGFGLSVVEAMYFGLPAVMTNVGVAGEIVFNNENGLIIEPGDEKGLVFALDKILRDGELREKLAKNGLVRANKFLENNKDYFHKITNNWKRCAKSL